MRALILFSLITTLMIPLRLSADPTPVQCESVENALLNKQKTATKLAENSARFIRKLEEIRSGARSVAFGSSVLFGVSASALYIAGSAKIAAAAAARAASSKAIGAIEKGARWFFLWRTVGNTKLGYVWEVTSNSAAVVLLNDSWAKRPLRPILEEIATIGTRDFQGSDPSHLESILKAEHARLRALEADAQPNLHDGRLMSMGWDDVHHIEVLLSGAKARLRLYTLEREGLKRLIWDLRASCEGAPYGEALRLAKEAQDTLSEIQRGKANPALVHITHASQKRVPKWRTASQYEARAATQAK